VPTQTAAFKFSTTKSETFRQYSADKVCAGRHRSTTFVYRLSVRCRTLQQTEYRSTISESVRMSNHDVRESYKYRMRMCARRESPTDEQQGCDCSRIPYSVLRRKGRDLVTKTLEKYYNDSTHSL
jgi:hypothetical protein